MKKLILLTLCICMMGCEESNVETKRTTHVISDAHTLDEVTIEGCQYLFGDWANATVLTHKGNCNNPIHVHNGGSHD